MVKPVIEPKKFIEFHANTKTFIGVKYLLFILMTANKYPILDKKLAAHKTNRYAPIILSLLHSISESGVFQSL